MDPGVAFGQVLRGLRREAGLSQEQLAFSAEIERNFVSLIERGVNQPSIRVIFKLAHALGISASQMLLLVENKMLDGLRSD
ncbi:helix-turn-helix domain-containing protein [Duganella qianjiadongensis]|uniref:Helix-turn-helix domain-containing protein n=1 Tax=Duganella qianjiadongensis TaxID=2692176 RepID=A0ABW9VSV7_9BURK|nr:helix-turn-helix transcriptional regulator [Duganella qianjiadongensis]MYM39448.1 helix-turn-helix domain-containing protein [Duganella qianjiadongensis]MYM42156.1 helix-turn-helix domain-containing protein [Duganella qianjiadongensis]